jgi:hypothetical protein
MAGCGQPVRVSSGGGRDCASNNCRSVSVIPCITTSSHSTRSASVRRDGHGRDIQCRVPFEMAVRMTLTSASPDRSVLSLALCPSEGGGLSGLPPQFARVAKLLNALDGRPRLADGMMESCQRDRPLGAGRPCCVLRRSARPGFAHTCKFGSIAVQRFSCWGAGNANSSRAGRRRVGLAFRIPRVLSGDLLDPGQLLASLALAGFARRLLSGRLEVIPVAGHNIAPVVEGKLQRVLPPRSAVK